MGLCWRWTQAQQGEELPAGSAQGVQRMEIHLCRMLSDDEALWGTERGDPAHQATWEAFMVLLAIRHFVTAEVRGELCWLVTLWAFG